MAQGVGDRYLQLFREFLENNYGVHYSTEKISTLEVKLNKLIAKNSIVSYKAYYGLIVDKKNTALLNQFLDETTTHTTNFFRENNHFNYIQKNLNVILNNNKRIIENNEIRVWSSACSSGEEPYTLGIVLKEIFPEDFNIKILATDISKKSVFAASKGIYRAEALENTVSKYYLTKYFIKQNENYGVAKEIKDLVTFRTFNLMDQFSFKKGFDIVFCRNVMIYFEPEVQADLVDKMYNVLVPGGLLFIGHSESLAFKEHKFKYIQPALYAKR